VELVETLMVSEAPAVHQYQDRQQFPHVLLSWDAAVKHLNFDWLNFERATPTF
jgi:hypothetical protein